MAKVTMGPQALLYPLPVLIIGANVNRKPNFMTVAWAGIACSDPPMLTVAIQPGRYTLKGIKQNLTFSVNVPSTDLVLEADYCGGVSGSEEDKAAALGFHVFYGTLGSAPLITECPVNLECRVAHVLRLGSHYLVIASIEETHVSEECITGGRVDVARIRPLAYSTSPRAQYFALGDMLTVDRG